MPGLIFNMYITFAGVSYMLGHALFLYPGFSAGPIRIQQTRFEITLKGIRKQVIMELRYAFFSSITVTKYSKTKRYVLSCQQ